MNRGGARTQACGMDADKRVLAAAGAILLHAQDVHPVAPLVDVVSLSSAVDTAHDGLEVFGDPLGLWRRPGRAAAVPSTVLTPILAHTHTHTCAYPHAYRSKWLGMPPACDQDRGHEAAMHASGCRHRLGMGNCRCLPRQRAKRPEARCPRAPRAPAGGLAGAGIGGADGLSGCGASLGCGCCGGSGSGRGDGCRSSPLPEETRSSWGRGAVPGRCGSLSLRCGCGCSGV